MEKTYRHPQDKIKKESFTCYKTKESRLYNKHDLPKNYKTYQKRHGIWEASIKESIEVVGKKEA